MELIRKTNLVKNKKYSEYSQNNVYLKLENLQVTGSLKVRALAKLVEKLKKDKYQKVVVISTGNTARSVAYLCEKYNLECLAYMPSTTSYSTIIEVQDYHATVVLEGTNIVETKTIVDQIDHDETTYVIDLAKEMCCSLAYEELVKEILEDLPSTDIILAPVGTGSLINGIISYIKNNDLAIEVYAVEPYSHALLSKSIEHNKPSQIADSYSIAESINGKAISELFFENIKNNITDVIRVSDEELIDCFLDVAEENKAIVENAGLLSLVGTKYLTKKKKNVVCLLTGGNIDITTMATVLESGLINKGRIFSFKVMLSDKPGELLEIAQIIAKNDGNVIGLNHNQLSAITRQNKVELNVSVESLGLHHKFKIVSELESAGYEIILIDDHLGCDFNG